MPRPDATDHPTRDDKVRHPPRSHNRRSYRPVHHGRLTDVQHSPLQAALGISLPLVGILLSANRLVRCCQQVGGQRFRALRYAMALLASVLVGLLSTAFYGIPAGFIVFLLPCPGRRLVSCARAVTQPCGRAVRPAVA